MTGKGVRRGCSAVRTPARRSVPGQWTPQFWALVCEDEEWLQAEFDAIVSAARRNPAGRPVRLDHAVAAPPDRRRSAAGRAVAGQPPRSCRAGPTRSGAGDGNDHLRRGSTARHVQSSLRDPCRTESEREGDAHRTNRQTIDQTWPVPHRLHCFDLSRADNPIDGTPHPRLVTHLCSGPCDRSPQHCRRPPVIPAAAFALARCRSVTAQVLAAGAAHDRSATVTASSRCGCLTTRSPLRAAAVSAITNLFLP